MKINNAAELANLVYDILLGATCSGHVQPTDSYFLDCAAPMADSLWKEFEEGRMDLSNTFHPDRLDSVATLPTVDDLDDYLNNLMGVSNEDQ